MTAAIRVEALGKRYQLTRGSQTGRYRTLRESLAEGVKAPFRRLRGAETASTTDDFWALNDVSFDVQPGEVVGIIGRNGAGKSTLLKVLSRITKPTKGRVEINGRVGSLLEVGTGFHPELTGRENVYLNGSILGMSRKEIDRKFDEIVAFAEVEKFLDTPVKRYSSGMYVRLAFAVAAHLEPEILIVDEVLAVGDATYQRRCINRMSELARSGITVLFVSHNMELIPRFCDKAVLLKQGAVDSIGQASNITARYINDLASLRYGQNLGNATRTGDGRAVFRRLVSIDRGGRPSPTHVTGDDLVLRMEIEARENIQDVALAVVLSNMFGTRIITSWTKEIGFRVDLEKGLQVLECRFSDLCLRPGHRLRIGLWMATQDVVDSVEDADEIDIVTSPESAGLSTNLDQGIVLCEYEWSRRDNLVCTSPGTTDLVGTAADR